MGRFFIKYIILVLLIGIPFKNNYAQYKKTKHHKKQIKKHKNTHRGTASYYSDEFIGKRTASGEIFSQHKYTAACNILPLGSTVIVTNLSNKRKVTVKINDRLNRNTKRLIDLSKIAAKKLDFIGKGLTSVKIEVIKND